MGRKIKAFLLTTKKIKEFVVICREIIEKVAIVWQEFLKRSVIVCGKFIKKIFIGPKFKQPYLLKITIYELKRQHRVIWNKDESIWFERFFKLILLWIQFINPYTWFRSIFDLRGEVCGRFFSDLWVIIKLVFSFIALRLFLFNNPYVIGICIYYIFDSFFIELFNFFLSGEIPKPVSIKRSTLFLLFNYLAITGLFSVLYRRFDLIKDVYCNTQAIYFGFVTSFTLGYGDCYPKNNPGQIVVIFQIIIVFTFVSLFLSKLISNFTNNAYDDALLAGKMGVVKNMLAKNMDEKLISQVSGLPTEQINALRKNIQKLH